MNNTLSNISISGIAFQIERSAHNMLSDYFSQVRRECQPDINANELIADLEARVAELILSHQTNHVVVTASLIGDILNQLGRKFSDEESEDNGATVKQIPPPYTTQHKSKTLRKRLFRDPAGRILGGVCSGIATYSGMDIAVARIIFILIFPAAFIVYLMLWMAIPLAKSPRDILEMRGTPITKENLETFMLNDMEQCDNKKTPALIVAIILIIGYIFKVILYIIIGSVVLAAAAFLIAIVVALTSELMEHKEYYSILVPGNVYVNYALTLILCGTPLVMFNMLLISTLFRKSVKRFVYGTMAILWAGVAVYGGAMAIYIKPTYRFMDTYQETINIPINGSLYITPTEPDLRPAYDEKKLDEDRIMHISMYSTTCKNCTTDTVKVIINKTAYGETRQEAYDRAKDMVVNYHIEDNKLYIDHAMRIGNRTELYNNCNIVIHTKEGSNLVIDNKFNIDQRTYRSNRLW